MTLKISPLHFIMIVHSMIGLSFETSEHFIWFFIICLFPHPSRAESSSAEPPRGIYQFVSTLLHSDSKDYDDKWLEFSLVMLFFMQPGEGAPHALVR